MRVYRADLHLHTVLSACAEVEMLPPLIVTVALQRGLDVIAVTDHNATANAQAVIEAAAGTPLHVLPGMELQTREEVDVLCLFDTLEQAADWQAFVDAHLPALANDVERFGPQYIVDAAGDFVAEDPHLRQGPTTIPLEAAIAEVTRRGGLAIPAHIDRRVKGLLGVLGLWPPDLQAEAAEVSPNLRPSQARQRYRFLPADLPLITASDAHFLDGIGQVLTEFTLNAPTIAEIRLAPRSAGGRSARVT